MNRIICVALLAIFICGCIDEVIYLPDSVVYNENSQHENSPNKYTTTNKNNLWENGEIYYHFAEEVNDIHIKKIEDCFNEIEEKTRCVYFIRCDERADSIEIKYSNDEASWATIGYNLVNFIKIRPTATTRNIFHEVLHTIGLLHEHQREDRDDHIVVAYENILPRFIPYFDVKRNTFYNIEDFPYDHKSIMHYNSFAFSTGNPTIYFFNEHDYNFALKPTKLDYDKIIAMYQR